MVGLAFAIGSSAMGLWVPSAFAQPAPPTDRAAELEPKLATAQGAERLDLLHQLALLHFQAARLKEARVVAEGGLALLAPGTDLRRELDFHKVLLSAYARERKLDLALEIGRRAEDLARQAGGPEDRGFVAIRLGDTWRYLGEQNRALAYYDQAAAFYTEASAFDRLGAVLNNKALIFLDREDQPAALSLLLEAHEAHEKSGDPEGMALNLSNLSGLLLEMGHYQEALAKLEIALEKAKDSNSWLILADIQTQIGHAHEEMGNLEQARNGRLAAREIYQRHGFPSRLVETELALGTLAEAQHQESLAAAHFAEAQRWVGQVQQAQHRAAVWRKMAEIEANRGHRTAAAELLRQAEAVYRSEGNRSELAAVLLEEANLGAKMGNFREAFAKLDEQREIVSESAKAENRRAMAEMLARFESREQSEQIESLTREASLKAAELERSQQLRLAQGGFFLVSLAVLGLLFNRFRLQTLSRNTLDKLQLERQVNTRLQEVDRMKTEFLANTSHELRTPLYGIIGMGEALRRQSGIEPEVAKDLGTIVAAARRMQNLVGDILDFSKVCAGGLTLVRRPTGLQELLRRSLEAIRPMVEQKQLRLFECLPSQTVWIDVDERRLGQILASLLDNAVKFTEEGEIEVSARALGAAGREGEAPSVEICVRDSGIGIAPEDQSRIFTSFTQLDGSTERSFSGTGLGLALARELLRLHGSELEVVSELGRGSTFRFVLPLAEPSAIPRDEGARLGLRVLVVDDEPVNRMVIGHQLEMVGYEVTEATSGLEALEKVGSADLVLLDVMMPEMSGFEVCRRIRARADGTAELPVIFVSARQEAEDFAEGLAVGGNEFLTKPVAMDELLTSVARHLRRS